VHGVDLVLRVAVGGRPHLAVFGACYGLLGGGRGVVIVAYLLGMKWAVDPGNAAAIGGGTRRLSGIGRRSVSSGFWFALGFATTVAGLAFLFTMGAQLFALRDLRLAPAVFLGLLAIVQVVVLIGAVRARRDGGGPVPRPGLERLIRWMRRAWQLYPVGALCGVGLGLAAEVALLVLAAGTVALILPFYLALCFAAGMCLVTALRGVFAADPAPARGTVVHIVFTVIVAVGALVGAGTAMFVNDLQLPWSLTAGDLTRPVRPPARIRQVDGRPRADLRKIRAGWRLPGVRWAVRAPRPSSARQAGTGRRADDGRRARRLSLRRRRRWRRLR